MSKFKKAILNRDLNREAVLAKELLEVEEILDSIQRGDIPIEPWVQGDYGCFKSPNSLELRFEDCRWVASQVPRIVQSAGSYYLFEDPDNWTSLPEKRKAPKPVWRWILSKIFG